MAGRGSGAGAGLRGQCNDLGFHLEPRQGDLIWDPEHHQGPCVETNPRWGKAAVGPVAWK